VFGRRRVGSLQQGDGFAVVLALRVFPEPDAADDVRGRDTGVDAKRREGICDVLVFFGEVAHEVRRGKELLGFPQPSLPDGCGARLGPHVRPGAYEAVCAARHDFRPR